jgi:hypothetical protein
MSYLKNVNAYFEAQNRSDAATVVGLFSETGTVQNAAMPPVSGHVGIRSFCENLYARTSARQFEVLSVLEGQGRAMAEWKVKMTFATGAAVGPHTLASSFEVELRGVNVFEFAPGGDKIDQLRVFHETSTVARLAAEHAR